MVLTTQIPVACVGVLTNSGHALKFSHVPSHGFVAWTRGSLGRNSPLPIPQRWHPRALHSLRAYHLPKLGSALPGDSPSTLTWQAGAPGPFPRVTRAHALPTRPMAPRAPHQRVTRAHYAIPAPHGPLAYRGRLARCPGTHSAILTVRSHAPNPSTGLPTPPSGFRAYFPTNSKTTSILSI